MKVNVKGGWSSNVLRDLLLTNINIYLLNIYLYIYIQLYENILKMIVHFRVNTMNQTKHVRQKRLRQG